MMLKLPDIHPATIFLSCRSECATGIVPTLRFDQSPQWLSRTSKSLRFCSSHPQNMSFSFLVFVLIIILFFRSQVHADCNEIGETVVLLVLLSE